MEKFTLKDFISYNNPCFNCNDKIRLEVITLKTIESTSPVTLKPIVSPFGTLVDLEITYTRTLQLYIEHKSNKITVTDMDKFADYLANHKLYFSAHCTNCLTNIQSFYLDFDLKRQYLKPTSINTEHLRLTDPNSIYYIRSSVFDGATDITVVGKSTRHETINFKMPLLLLGKFKTKEKWLQKLKTYLIFS